MSEIKKCRHGRNFCCECHMAEDLKSARKAMKLDNQCIYPAGTSRDLQGELNEAQSQLAALREELAACKSITCMLESREWAEHAGKGPISEALEHAITDMHNELSDAQQRLADAERRNVELSACSKRKSRVQVVAYANNDELSNLLDDRNAVVSGVADGWRATGLVLLTDHLAELNTLVEWGIANQQLAQYAMDELETAMADCDNLKMHIADHRAAIDAALNPNPKPEASNHE